MTAHPHAQTPPSICPQRAIDELTVLADIAQAQFLVAKATVHDHPLSPRAHLRIHTLRNVIGLLAALITMFASTGQAPPQPKPRRPHPGLRIAGPAGTAGTAHSGGRGQVQAARRLVPRACRAGAAPNLNVPLGARAHAPHRLIRPGAPIRQRPSPPRQQATR